MEFFKKLIGETIYLSPRNTENAEKFTTWLNDFQVTDYLGKSSFTVSLKDEIEYFEKNANNQGNFFIVTLNEDKLIGTIGFTDIDYINRTAVLGIFIGDESYRNKGIGTEAINLLLDYAFNYLNLYSIKLEVMEFNIRAQKCYKKCGFKEYGRRRKCKYVNGKYYDSIGMDILRDEFNGNYIKNKNI